LEELGSLDGVADIEEYEHAAEFESRSGGPGATDRGGRGGEAGPLPAGRGARSALAKSRPKTGGGVLDSPTVTFQTGTRRMLMAKTTSDQRAEIGAWTEQK